MPRASGKRSILPASSPAMQAAATSSRQAEAPDATRAKVYREQPVVDVIRLQLCPARRSQRGSAFVAAMGSPRYFAKASRWHDLRVAPWLRQPFRKGHT